jgi:FMN phosphatase YigB (HAD superfamily)
MTDRTYDTLIFDLDNTLYHSSQLVNYRTELTEDWIEENTDLNQAKAQSFYRNLSDEYPHPYDGFTAIGLTIDSYFENVSYKLTPSDFVDKNEFLSELFSDVDTEIIIVSLGPHSYIQQMTDAIGISEHISSVYNPYQDANAHSKYSIYKRYAQNTVLVTGDSYANDIQPASELGFDTVHVAPTCSVADSHSCINSINQITKYIS